MPYGKDQMNFNCLQMKVSELPLFLCCFGSTYIIKLEDKHGSCTRMTHIIVKCSTFLCPQYMKWHVCKIYNQPYIYLFRRPVSFVFLAYFVFYNSEAVDVDIWDRVQHLSLYINIMSAGSQQLVDVVSLRWTHPRHHTRLIWAYWELQERFKQGSSAQLNHDQDVKPQSGTSIILQSPKWGLKGHGCSLHLQNQDRKPKFGSWVHQRPVTISKSRSRCKTPVRNLHHPPKPQIRT